MRFRSIPWFVTVVALLASSLPAAAADLCANLKSMEEIYSALQGKDFITQLKAKKCGLQSDDRGARGLVIYKYFSDGDTENGQGSTAAINLTIENTPGDKESADIASKMPSFAIWHLHWTPAGNSFTGIAPFENYTSVSGNLIEDTLSITYHNWPIVDAKGKPMRSDCSATLNPNEKKTALEGTLTCSNLAYRFRIFVGI